MEANNKAGTKIVLYKYMQSKFLKPFIETGKIKITKIDETNDPFENLPRFEPRRELDHLLANMSQAIDWPAENAKSLDENDLKFKKFYTDLRKTNPARYISFSGKCSNMLMWSHYAESHKGVCLVFEIELKDRCVVGLPNVKVAKINYSEQRVSLLPILIYGICAQAAPIDQHEYILSCKAVLELANITKSLDWQYEREVRLEVDLAKVEQEGELEFFGDLRPFIKGIILGPLNAKSDEDIKTMLSTNSGAFSKKPMVARAKIDSSMFLVNVPGFEDVTDEEYQNWSYLTSTHERLFLYLTQKIRAARMFRTFVSTFGR